MKTNKEAFLEKLKEADMHHFVELVTGCGKCTRCSNYFWDGNATGCHKNINKSSCEEGIVQYMESGVHENLQVKYGKKYSTFRSYFHAVLGRQLTTVLFQANVVEKLEPPCEICKSNDCSGCDRFWSNILDMSRNYANGLGREQSEQSTRPDISGREYYGKDILFIKDILLPRIQDPELRVEAKVLIELILSKDYE